MRSETTTDPGFVAESGPALVKELKIVLDPQKVFFNTSSAQLRPKVRDILGDIGSYLGKHPGDVREIEIAGHADRRGGYEYNLMLSRKRAGSVRDTLAEAGTPEDKMKVKGYSYLKPLDPAANPSAWAKNRRVEIVFRDVRNPAYIREKIRELTDDSVAGTSHKIRHGGQG